MRPALRRLVGALLSASLGAALATLPSPTTAGAAETAGLARGPVGKAGTDPVTALLLGQRAHDYGFPLLEFERVRREETSVQCPDGAGNAPLNSFSHSRRLVDASFRDVVAPNTDTLYSIAQLDLGKGPIMLRHPAMGERYYSFALLDPYTNVIATPGAREDGGGAAAIQVRWDGRRGTKVAGTTRVITSPHRRVWVIGRTLAGDRADQRTAYRLMKRYTLTLPDGTRRHFARDCNPGKASSHPTPTSGRAFLRRLSTALVRNPPPRRDADLLSALRPYGIGPGLTPSDAGLDPVTERALYAGVSTGAKTLLRSTQVEALVTAAANDGWYDPPHHIGDYGTDYRFRAQIAAVGLGANTPEEAIYPAGLTDGTGLPYLGSNAYRLTFERGNLPPVRYFWSLTMYDIDGYLVPNPGDRYSVGTSHPPLARKRDGSIVIVVQPTAPSEKRVNWLPPPPGPFRLNLRLYGPDRTALDGSWSAPPVRNMGPAL